jgi:hypothetical protein
LKLPVVIEANTDTPVPAAKNDKRKLTAKQQALVDEMLANGSRLKQAAEVAGYADYSTAWREWQKPHLQEAFLTAARSELVSDVGLALRTRRELLSARSEKVRMEAVRDVLDRAGLVQTEQSDAAPTQVNVQINLGMD